MTEIPDPELLRRLDRAILNLPKRQRDIFVACRVHGMPYGEIAGRTGLSTRQVERQLAKALVKIARHMDGQKLRWWERLF